MYSGDELYGEEITSPLFRPIKAKSIKVTLECMECEKRFKVSDDQLYECECPSCGSTDLEIA